jgi:hypothetical protein
MKLAMLCSYYRTISRIWIGPVKIKRVLLDNEARYIRKQDSHMDKLQGHSLPNY